MTDDFRFTVIAEDEQQTIDVRHLVAEYLSTSEMGLDVTQVDRSRAVWYSSQLGALWMRSVIRARQDFKPSRWSVFVVYVKPGRKAWVDSNTWEQAKQQSATESEKKRVIDEMMRHLAEDRMKQMAEEFQRIQGSVIQSTPIGEDEQEQ